MRQAVRDAWVAFNSPMEGMLGFPYLDQHRDPATKKLAPLLTVGMGNMIDGPDAFKLPWTMLYLRPATPEEIREGIAAVKARTDLVLKGGAKFAPVSNLRLAQADINALIFKRLASNEVELLKYFPKLAAWCADAEMGAHSLAWAMGGDFDEHDRWPSFTKAANSGDWLDAAIQSHMSNGAPARNAANYSLFVNAAVVAADALNPDLLVWPAKLSPDPLDAA